MEHAYSLAFGALNMVAFLFKTANTVMPLDDSVQGTSAPKLTIILFSIWHRHRLLVVVLVHNLDQLAILIEVNLQERMTAAWLDVIDEQVVQLLF